jgi:hypothetical protein
MMDLTATQAEALALDFLMNEWNVASDDREWFTPLSARFIGESWYVVEIGLEGLPDKWVIQVYDTGECDPSYTFVTPIPVASGYADLSDLPEMVAEMLVAERNSR